VVVLPLLFASLQLIELRSQPATDASETEKAPGATFGQTFVLDSVGSLSSSSEKLAQPGILGDVKAKSWASLGTASLTMVIEPRFVLTKVHVTDSPASR